MSKPTDIDPSKFLLEVFQDAEKRAAYSLISPSWLTDTDWQKAQELARKKGPLSAAQFAAYSEEHDKFAQTHFLDLLFECERLYAFINWLK